MTPQQKMTRCKIALMLEEPFFGSLLMNLKAHEDVTCPTMATNGTDLIWGPSFVARLSEPEIKTVLAHEALHCALLHHLRRGERNPQAWNIAADFAVNLLLEECNDEAKAKGRTPPFVWPTDPKPLLDKCHKGKSAEEIYCAPPPGGSGGGQGQGQRQGQGNGGDDQQPGMGDVQDAPGAKDPAESSQQEANWKQATVQAAMAAKARGTCPASMRQLVEDLLHPKASWQEILRRFVSDRAKDDYCWARPNPRYLQSGFILPSLDSQRLGTIVVIRDTSGSTWAWQAEVMAELASIIHECRPAKVVVIDADAKVQRTLELEPGDALPEDTCGGGGTDFRPALEHAEQFNPVCCVYVTDLDGTMPRTEPSFPVLWATDSDSTAPFGEMVKI